MLLIGTDGIWETRADTGEMFGTERVCQLLTEHKDLNADSIAEKILAALALFRGDCPQDDDVTLIIVKTT
jgi:sigma-B regulation protein RsbU (phosphoserine phosphatase)